MLDSTHQCYLLLRCIGRHSIITWFENHVYGAAHRDGVGSQNTQLLTRSCYFKQNTISLYGSLLMK